MHMISVAAFNAGSRMKNKSSAKQKISEAPVTTGDTARRTQIASWGTSPPSLVICEDQMVAYGNCGLLPRVVYVCLDGEKICVVWRRNRWPRTCIRRDAMRCGMRCGASHVPRRRFRVVWLLAHYTPLHTYNSSDDRWVLESNCVRHVGVMASTH
ncbi:hypothetical protein BJY00DRAFT_269582 [Aspergillus carlsbadensis]|nr:hypothetical protein BJY00DRAFT_269582 [Aspergillus carlsbadensis]